MHDDIEVWSKSLKELELQMTRATFNTWLKGTRLIDSSDHLFTIEARTEYAVDWLQMRLQDTISRTVSVIAGREIKLLFVLAQQRSAEPEKVNYHSNGSAETKQPPHPTSYVFHGFYAPKSHWVKVPHYLTDDVPRHVKAATFQLVMTVWRRTWGVVDGRGNHRELWITHLKAIVAATGLSLNSVKRAITEGRDKGLIVQIEANSAAERKQYECENAVSLHVNTLLIGLRPRWDDEEIDQD